MHYYFKHWHTFLQPCLVFQWAWGCFNCFKAPWGQGTVPWTHLSTHSSQLDSPSHCYYVCLPREGRNSSSRHSFPDPCLTLFLHLQREGRNVQRNFYQLRKMNFALEKSYLEKELNWASPALFPSWFVVLGKSLSLSWSLFLSLLNKQDGC